VSLHQKMNSVEREVTSLRSSNQKLRQQRDSVKKMFHRSQETLKKTLVECKKMQHKLREQESAAQAYKEVEQESEQDMEQESDRDDEERVKRKSNKARLLSSTAAASEQEKEEDVKSALKHSSSPRKSRETRGTLLRHISSIKGALEGFLQASLVPTSTSIPEEFARSMSDSALGLSFR